MSVAFPFVLKHDCTFIETPVACYKFFVGDTIMGIDEMMYDNMRNYDVNGAGTAHIHVVIPVIDRNYEINDIVTANFAKSIELYHDSGD